MQITLYHYRDTNLSVTLVHISIFSIHIEIQAAIYILFMEISSKQQQQKKAKSLIN